MKRLVVFPLLAVLLLFTACANTSGSMSGVQANCQPAGDGGKCDLEISELSGGPVAQPVKSSTFTPSDNEAQVTVRVSSESGALRVGLTSENGEQKTVEVQPGEPVEITAPARIIGTTDDRTFSVEFTATDGKASGVKAEILYQKR